MNSQSFGKIQKCQGEIKLVDSHSNVMLLTAM